MNKITYILILLIFTYGCKTIKQGLGIEKDVPDEFLIKKLIQLRDLQTLINTTW